MNELQAQILEHVKAGRSVRFSWDSMMNGLMIDVDEVEDNADARRHFRMCIAEWEISQSNLDLMAYRLAETSRAFEKMQRA